MIRGVKWDRSATNQLHTMGPGAERRMTQGLCHPESHYTQGTRYARGSEKEELDEELGKLLQNVLKEMGT